MTDQAQPSALFPQQVLGTTILINGICLVVCLLTEYEVVLRSLALSMGSNVCVRGKGRGCIAGSGFPLKYLRHKATVPALSMCQAML
jgi:hypothetical protein